MLTFFDADVSVEYQRSRVAELRAMSSDRYRSLEIRESREKTAGFRQRIGAALVAVGERVGGFTATPTMPSRPAAGRLS